MQRLHASRNRPLGTLVAAVFILAQLLAVFIVYYLHQRSVEQQNAEAWPPAQTQELLLSLNQPINASLHLYQADLELLRREIASIISGLPLAKALDDAAEQAAMLLPSFVSRSDDDELPPNSNILRLADEPFGPKSNENIPGVQDIHQEFTMYTETLLKSWDEDFSIAAARQEKAMMADDDSNNDVVDLDSIDARIQFLNDLAAEKSKNLPTKVAIAATSSVDLQGVRSEILPWLQYHTELEVSKFYILYDGTDAEAVQKLSAIQNVELIHIHPPWATPTDQALFETQTNISRQWKSRQGNYELMNKQGFCLTQALRRARLDKISWLMHLDPDELFLPGGRETSLVSELTNQPLHVPAVRFLNFEGQLEAGNVKNRFDQITLFRVHKHLITPEAFWYRNKFKLGDNSAFLMLYANGKSAVRVDAGGVRHSGPHYFIGDSSPQWATPENPLGIWSNAVSDTSVVLHYAYSKPAEVAAKAHRSCSEDLVAAAKAGDRETVKNTCFVIDFDADAFMAAIKGEKAVEEFYYSRMVLSENAPVKCSRAEDGKHGWCGLRNIPRFIHLMEKIGLYRRVLMPQMVLRQHERLIKSRLLLQLTHSRQ